MDRVERDHDRQPCVTTPVTFFFGNSGGEVSCARNRHQLKLHLFLWYSTGLSRFCVGLHATAIDPL